MEEAISAKRGNGSYKAISTKAQPLEWKAVVGDFDGRGIRNVMVAKADCLFDGKLCEQAVVEAATQVHLSSTWLDAPESERRSVIKSSDGCPDNDLRSSSGLEQIHIAGNTQAVLSSLKRKALRNETMYQLGELAIFSQSTRDIMSSRPSSSGSAGDPEPSGYDAPHHPDDVPFALSGEVAYLHPIGAIGTTSHSVEPLIGNVGPSVSGTTWNLDFNGISLEDGVKTDDTSTITYPSASELFEQPEPGSASDWASIESNIQRQDDQQVKEDVAALLKARRRTQSSCRTFVSVRPRLPNN